MQRLLLTCRYRACGCCSQEQIEDMKKKEERMEKEMGEIQQQNRKLIEPLKLARESVDELHRQLGNYHKDKVSLSVSRLGLCVASLLPSPYCFRRMFTK